MRWIDIILPEPEINQTLDDFLADAAKLTEEIEGIQLMDGLDSVNVTKQMAKAGQLLFKGVTAVDAAAFSPDPSRPGATIPNLDMDDHDALVGYHLVVDPAWSDLPWTWLHNGLAFLLEKHPLCWSTRPSKVPEGAGDRPWMQRFVRAGYLVAEDGATSLRGTLPQLRQKDTRQPEMLFIPGHSDQRIRRMIYRESEAIQSALQNTHLGQTLTQLHVPRGTLTPTELASKGIVFQGLHFAGPTSHPAAPVGGEDQTWMGDLLAEMDAPSDRELEDAIGIEGEVLGVDPITSLLDTVSEKFEKEIATASMGGSLNGTPPPMREAASGHNWLLEDGPVEPETLGSVGVVPPLVFSNSYRSQPELGRRFIAAGASTFVGPVVPLFSRPARIFVGHCYDAMGNGWCAGSAVWRASQAIRTELGADHPAWLSYGVQGYGSLALQYL